MLIQFVRGNTALFGDIADKSFCSLLSHGSVTLLLSCHSVLMFSGVIGGGLIQNLRDTYVASMVLVCGTG